MKLQLVELIEDFNCPIHMLFAYLSVHENVGKLLGSNFRHVEDGLLTKYGVGSVRDIKNPLMPVFQETVLTYEENRLIEYKITSGFAPITEHFGRMVFIELDGNHCRLEYRIQFKGRFPFIGGLIRSVMQTNGENNLRKLML